MGNFQVQLLKHSINRNNNSEAITFGFTYERFIHAEMMTHRWSRNYSSSRAIPTETMNKWIAEDPALPLHLGANKSGMQSGGQIKEVKSAYNYLKGMLEDIFYNCNFLVKEYDLHKEIVNRYTEPWGWITGVATTGRAQLMNMFNLRISRFAHPNIQRLAVNMARTYRQSTPQVLDVGQWHTPYFDEYIPEGSVTLNPHDKEDRCYSNLDLGMALTWSVARCAWVSYNNPTKDATFAKAKKRHDDCVQLKHVTPCEHQLRACSYKGVGAVPGWESYRMMIPNESAAEFDFGILDREYADRDYVV